ncbi:MAG: hypothetical protein V3T09_08470 [bacterium]
MFTRTFNITIAMRRINAPIPTVIHILTYTNIRANTITVASICFFNNLFDITHNYFLLPCLV